MQWESLYMANGLENKAQPVQLFQEAVKMPALPDFEYTLVQHLYDEIELLGFPVRGSWFDMLRSDYRATSSHGTCRCTLEGQYAW